MSISPNNAQDPQSSTLTDPRTNPSSDHGIADRRHPRRRRGPSHEHPERSNRPELVEPAGQEAGQASGSAVAISGDSGGSSRNVAEDRNSHGWKGSSGQSNCSSFTGQSTVRGGISSQSGSDPAGLQINRRTSGAGRSFQSGPSGSVSSGLQGTVSQSPSRRNQVGNANYLLNFYYDPISRPPPRGAPPRKPRKIKPYNKDLFLQANYKFVVLDTGYHQVESIDPDKMLQWEDIICLRYSTPFPIQCPICLETPLCPQITSCGHIYCFPCILRYLLMGKEDHKRDCWKKCPLCFMMISSKDLSTVQIENVKQFHVGDHVDFTLLTRQKDSLVPLLKNRQQEDPIQYNSDGIHYSFSKFTLTSDVEFYMQEAKSDLRNWLIRAETGLVDDLEKLPYVCAASEQLEERIKIWMEQLSIGASPHLRHVAIASPNFRVINVPKANNTELVSTSTSNDSISTALESGGITSNSDLKDKKLDEMSHAPHSHVPKTATTEEKLMLLDDDGASQNSKDDGEKDAYVFYQAIDGQHLILHPLDMRCLLHHYGSYDRLPLRISGEILEMETLTQSEAIRKRYRYLSHISLTTTIQLCEIDLEEILPASSLAPFKDEIKKRERQRKQIARKEQNEKAKAEVAASQRMLVVYDQHHMVHKGANFSSDDFEALGNGIVPSTSPPINSDRKRFSDVTRLGFAAAHDSPSLKAEGSTDVSGNPQKATDTSSTQARKTLATLSFASITSAAKVTGPSAGQATNGLGKKGKKPNKVLLSTAGGRRY